MYDQSIVLQRCVWPMYCITKVNKVLYYKSKQRCMMTKVLYYKSKQRYYVLYKGKQRYITKVLYYKSKQRCYDQSIVLQK